VLQAAHAFAATNPCSSDDLRTVACHRQRAAGSVARAMAHVAGESDADHRLNRKALRFALTAGVSGRVVCTSFGGV
jgi:hypothetical protein